MSLLAFLSPDRSAPEVRLVSPLSRTAVRETPGLGVLELRGDVRAVTAGAGEELVRLTPTRGLLLTEGPPAAALARLRADGVRAYDLTAGLAAIELDGEPLMRRLTELDLDALPAMGPVARGVGALLQRTGPETFRILVPQELAHYVAETALDLAEGLGR